MSFQKDINKFKLRTEQSDVLSYIDSVYKSNKLNKFFLLNLPTGVGKSVLALNIVKWYRENVNKVTRVNLITSTKILQDQYERSFDSLCNLKGKENYECEQYASSCQQGSEFNRLNKTKCESCPYITSRDSFMNGGIGLTNFYLYILYSMYNEKMLRKFRDARVLIVDECHELDDIMSDFISMKLTETIIKKYKFPEEFEIIKMLKSVKNISDYIEVLNFINPLIEDIIEQLDNSICAEGIKADKRDNKISKVLKEENNNIKIMKLISDLSQFKIKIDVFLKEYKYNPDNWVLEQSYNEKTRQKDLSLEPIWAYDYLDKYIYSHYDMVFFMSGTILDKNLFCQLNGIDASKASYYSINSPFPIENRPIIYMPLGKMSFKNKEDTFKKYVPYLKKILNKYKDKKGIIHTNSFELSNWIQREIKDERLIFHDSSNKDEMFRKHIESKKPTVIVSPSMDTGVSFDDDLARFQVIAKIPYPSLASQKNKIRMSNNSVWYSWKTAATLQQACGRIVRSNSDYGDTIIIDGSFGDIIRHNSKFLPNWFQESIKVITIKENV